MFRKIHNRKGFTFIEAIVVAVIVLILAGIGIPIYMGYLADARQSTVDNLAETAAAAANTFVRKRGAANLTVDALELYYDDTKYSVTLHAGNQSVTVAEIGMSSPKTKTVSYQ